jgi:hypothetical protein
VITEPKLARPGGDVILPRGQHTRLNVYSEMLLQVVRDYPGIGDWRELEEHEIEFFYNALRPELRKMKSGS